METFKWIKPAKDKDEKIRKFVSSNTPEDNLKFGIEYNLMWLVKETVEHSRLELQQYHVRRPVENILVLRLVEFNDKFFYKSFATINSKEMFEYLKTILLTDLNNNE